MPFPILISPLAKSLPARGAAKKGSRARNKVINNVSRVRDSLRAVIIARSVCAPFARIVFLRSLPGPDHYRPARARVLPSLSRPRAFFGSFCRARSCRFSFWPDPARTRDSNFKNAVSSWLYRESATGGVTTRRAVTLMPFFVTGALLGCVFISFGNVLTEQSNESIRSIIIEIYNFVFLEKLFTIVFRLNFKFGNSMRIE